jgi:hypothetical protein
VRPQGWESLLAAHIASARPFAWGENDCVLWCADWVKTVTGIDPAQDWRGKYTSEDDARSILNAIGCLNWSDLAGTCLSEIPVSRAQRGDILLHPINGCLGICDGAHAYFLTQRGVTRIGFTQCPKAWKVG